MCAVTGRGPARPSLASPGTRQGAWAGVAFTLIFFHRSRNLAGFADSGSRPGRAPAGCVYGSGLRGGGVGAALLLWGGPRGSQCWGARPAASVQVLPSVLLGSGDRRGPGGWEEKEAITRRREPAAWSRGAVGPGTFSVASVFLCPLNVGRGLFSNWRRLLCQGPCMDWFRRLIPRPCRGCLWFWLGLTHPGRTERQA